METARRTEAALREFGARLGELGRTDAPLLAARLTLVTLLFAPIGVLDLRAAVLCLAAAGLVAPRLAESALLWLLLAALAALRVVADWPLADNHAYLLATWCLALGLAFASRAPGPPLAANARALIGLAFVLATLQKLAISPDYVDGTFFRWLLATDDRFEALGALLGRDHAALAATRAWVEVGPGDALLSGAAWVEPPALRAAAIALTWLTLVIEGAVAVAFLAPARWLPPLARDATLLAFCAGTYALAPVAGFGWLLLAMGVAQTPSRLARWLYLAAFVLIAFYREVPWLELLAAG